MKAVHVHEEESLENYRFMNSRILNLFNVPDKKHKEVTTKVLNTLVFLYPS
jgi:hypothetical protein